MRNGERGCNTPGVRAGKPEPLQQNKSSQRRRTCPQDIGCDRRLIVLLHTGMQGRCIVDVCTLT